MFASEDNNALLLAITRSETDDSLSKIGAKTSQLNERGTAEKDGEVDIRESEGTSEARQMDEKQQASSSHDSSFEDAQRESNSSSGRIIGRNETSSSKEASHYSPGHGGGT